MHGSFIISLDFEQAWGMEGARAYGTERPAILGARTAIPRMLDLLERYRVRCTWATVGLLFFGDRDALLAGLPALRPRYADPALSPYLRLDAVGRCEKEDPLHFGRSLIERIRDCPGQEIAGHSFSHYYALEDGGDAAAFAADLDAARRAALSLGVALKSIVFPRNQVREAYLPLCHRAGYRCFRGVQRSRLHRSRPRGDEGRLTRLARAADNYLPLLPDAPARPRITAGLVDVPASRFLRPAAMSRAVLNRLQLRRIRDAMTRAARTGGLYHLWWHPQNFGRDIDLNLAMLTGILDHYARLAGDYAMASTTMGDFADAREAAA